MALGLIAVVPAEAQKTSKPAQTGETSSAAGPTAGSWMMSYPNVLGRPTVVLADLAKPATYRVCRNTLDGLGSDELYVYVDDQPVRSGGAPVSNQNGDSTSAPFNNYSLDEASCFLAKGKKFALRYAGGSVSLNLSLAGRYAMLGTNGAELTFSNISKWAMAWKSGALDFHDVVLINNLAGIYRVCIDAIQAVPAQGYVNIGLEVDGVLLRFGAQEIGYRGGTCMDVDGSNIVVRQLSWSPGLSEYRITGSLSLLDGTQIPINTP